MPDASGTPTTNHAIPTYNTGVDPPSGKGFNTAMSYLDTLLNNVAVLAGLVARTIVKKNGTSVGTRRAINFIEGSNITLTVADDPGNEEVDVTIGAAATAIGQELGFTQVTSPVTVSNPAEGSATVVVTAPAVVLDGSTTVLITFSVPELNAMTANSIMRVNVWGALDGAAATDLGRVGTFVNTSGSVGSAQGATITSRHTTPAAGSWVYSIRAHSSTANFQAGGGTPGQYRPLFIRVTRV